MFVEWWTMKTQKKAIILEEAKSLFLNKGYNETSLQKIIDNTGTSKGCLFHHYDSKVALGMEVERELLQDMYCALLAQFPGESPQFYLLAMQRLFFRLIFSEENARTLIVELLRSGAILQPTDFELSDTVMRKHIEQLSPSQMLLCECAGNAFFQSFLPEISSHVAELDFEEVFVFHISTILKIWNYPENECIEEIKYVQKKTANYTFIIDHTEIKLCTLPE